MNRRQFLQSAAVLPFAAAGIGGAPEADELKRCVITKITGFRHVGQRPRFVGKNSHLDDHGRTTTDHVLRIMTDRGVEGIGVGNVTPEVARRVIGHSLAEFWSAERKVVSPLGRADHALYDLIGKVLGVPAWKLLGGEGPEWVPLYDGSIYFDDLQPEFADRGVDRIVEEVQAGLDSGHRAFKIKVGRGFKWMEPGAGFRRDVEVMRAVRKLVGPKVRLMVDANNAFDLDGTIRWLDAVDDDLFFVEEMFPERVEDDLKLKEYLKAKGRSTLVADGESAREVGHFDPYLKAGALDVLQADIRAFGLTLLWELSRRATASGHSAVLAPHNWGSFLGVYMMVVLGRGIPNFLMAEEDTSSSDLFDVSAFVKKDGLMKVPDTPGCGLVLREDVFQAKYRKEAWTVDRD